MRICVLSATKAITQTRLGSTSPEWLEACRREEAIRELLSRPDGERLKLTDVEEVALDRGVSRAPPLHRLITIYRRTPTVEALEPRRRGRRKRAQFLDKPPRDDPEDDPRDLFEAATPRR
jgi:hypothetical protein